MLVMKSLASAICYLVLMSPSICFKLAAMVASVADAATCACLLEFLGILFLTVLTFFWCEIFALLLGYMVLAFDF